MSEYISPLLQWLNANPQYAGLATFIISAGESVAILGTIVPGTIMMTALGALAGAGVIPLWSTIFWAIIGAIVGDGISYWIGHYFKDRLPYVWPFRHHPSLLITGEKFFHKYGAMSVFIGRFVGPVRALVPLVAGMLGMKPLQFTIANVTSAIGWAPAYMLPGILLGAASLELPADIAIHVILVLLLIGLFTLLCLWFVYKILQLIHNQTTQLQNAIWQYLNRSRHLSSLTVLLKHHHPASHTHGQLNLAFYFLISSFLFLALAVYVKFYGPSTIAVNDVVYHLFRGIRQTNVDTIMIGATLLGQKQVILPVVGIFFLWLMWIKHWRTAYHALALGILSSGSVFVFKHIICSPRPWGIVHAPDTYSMPSGHATLSTTVFMGLAFLIALSIQSKAWRRLIYSVAITIVLFVGVSRLYLGAHWFTDVIAGWLLSSAVLLLVIISYQRENALALHPVRVLGITLVAMSVTFGIYWSTHIKQLTINYTQLNWPTQIITMDSWWEKNEGLAAYRTSLFGFPSQRINLEWSGDLADIREALIQAGWGEPPERNWISTLHRMADVRSTQFLPMVSPQYLDKKPELILAKRLEKKNLMVLRLWNANRIIKESNKPLWVGIINVADRSYSWIFKPHRGELDINPQLVFPQENIEKKWQWKLVTMPETIYRGKLTSQHIMLIKPYETKTSSSL